MIKFVGNPRLIDCCGVGTITEAVEYCESKSILGVDTETTGLNFMEEEMTMLQIGDGDVQFVIDTRAIDISPLRKVLESKHIKKVLHNVTFDYKFLLKNGIRLENVWDTMLASQVLNCGKKMSHKLNNLVFSQLHIEMSKEVRTTFIGHTGEFSESQIVYGAKDVEYLLHLQAIQTKHIEELDMVMLMQLENDAALAYGDIEFNGIGLDIPAWKKLSIIAENKRVEMELTLDEYINTKPTLSTFVAREFQTDMFIEDDDIRKIEVKWTSPKQVLNVFLSYGLEIEDVNADTLHVFRKDEFIDLYIKYKEQAKLATSYGEKFLKNVDSDERVRTKFKQILNTGRIASSGPNLQQIPANNAYRNCFISGDSDWVFVSSDYSSQELAIIATGSKDPVWLAALQEGKDLHSVCAELVYKNKWVDAAEDDCNFYAQDNTGEMKRAKCNCKQHKKLRTNVKSINFGLAYGMGPMKLADSLLITERAAEQLIKDYFKAFPSIENFLRNLGTYGLQTGHIKTYAPYRRMRWFPEWKGYDTSQKEKGKIKRASMNTPIQGSGADMCKSALTLVRDYIHEHNYPAKIVMTVHDQIDTIVRRDKADEWCEIFQGIMEQSTLEIIPSGLLKADTNVSETWEK